MSLRWYVARTNPRCEQRAVMSLARSGFTAYCPHTYSAHLHHRSKAEIERRAPLMVGYAFVAFQPGEEHFGFARGCDGIHSFLGVQGKPISVPSGLVEALHRDEFRGEFVSLSPAIVARREEKAREGRMARRSADPLRLSGGEMVRVTKGVFASRSGVVAKLFGKTRALIQLEGFMGTLQEVNVDIDALRLCA